MASFFQENKEALGFVAAGAAICASAWAHPMLGAIACTVGIGGAFSWYNRKQREAVRQSDEVEQKRCTRKLLSSILILGLSGFTLNASHRPLTTAEIDTFTSSQLLNARNSVFEGRGVPKPTILEKNIGYGWQWEEEKQAVHFSISNAKKDGKDIVELTYRVDGNTAQNQRPTETTAWRDPATGKWTVLKSVPLPEAKP